MKVTQSNLARADAAAEGVRLDFGVSVPRKSVELTDVRRLQRIYLDPHAAANLLELLNKLVLQQQKSGQGHQ
jgi:hypothetical protein